jgi:uncharacterized protein DUF6683
MRTRKMAAGKRAYLLLVWIVLLAATIARPAAAQDFQPGDVGINLGMSALNQERINSVIRLTGKDYKSGSTPSPTRPRVSKFDSGYRAAPAVTQQVIKDFLSSLQPTSNETRMRKAQEILGRYNFVTFWRDVLRSQDFPAGDDMADALASYVLLHWGMANNRMLEEYDKVSYRAVRDQIHSVMAATPAFASMSDADRQSFAETMMIRFAFLYSNFLNASGANDKALARRLSDEAHQWFLKRFRMNLRDLDLTRDGLVARK